MTILSILNALESTSSRNEKIRILQEHKNNPTVQLVFRCALDPLITYGIKKIPGYTAGDGCMPLVDAIKQLDVLKNREKTGHAGIAFLATTLASVSPNDRVVLERIVQKDLRCGVLATTCNAVWGTNFIPDFPVMKAKPLTPESMAKIVYPAYSQMKVDGARTQLRTTSTGIIAYSSNGFELTTHGVFDYLRTANSFKDTTGWVIDGELVVLDANGNVLPRKKGNGIINKAIKGTITVEEAKRLRFIAFDLIPETAWLYQSYGMPYENRYAMLLEFALHFSNNAEVVETVTVNSEQEANAHFKTLYRDRKLEGTVVKNLHGTWSNTRSSDQVKMTGILSCDLEIYDFVPGTGKYTGKIGSLLCKTDDGLLTVGVSGLTDEERAKPFSEFEGRIVEVLYKEKIQDDKSWSLFAPRIFCIRLDKNRADTLDLVK